MFTNLQLWFAEYFKLATSSVRFQARDLFLWLRLSCFSLLPPFRLPAILVVRLQSLFQILSVGLSLTELLSNTVSFALVILLWSQHNDQIIYEGSAHEICLRLCWHMQIVTGNHFVFSYRLPKRKGTFACLGAVWQIKVTFQLHNPGQQDQGRPSMHSSIMESSETFIPPPRESVLACLQLVLWWYGAFRDLHCPSLVALHVLGGVLAIRHKVWTFHYVIPCVWLPRRSSKVLKVLVRWRDQSDGVIHIVETRPLRLMVLCQWDSYLNPPADFYGLYSLGRTILEQV
jgi:hypothetical protein